MGLLGDIGERYRFWSTADRIGPDIPLTHWRLHFPSLMDKLCQRMFRSFGTGGDLASYKACPARVSLTETNPPDAPGARRSAELDFSEADAIPDLEFSEILWKAIKGEDSVMPAPVRTAFVRPIK